PTAPRAAERPVAADASATAAMRERYVRRIRELTHVDEVTGLTVVLDAGNGMAGRLLGEVFGTDVDPVRVPFAVIGLFTELDGTFHNHAATPLKPDTLVHAPEAIDGTGPRL